MIGCGLTYLAMRGPGVIAPASGNVFFELPKKNGEPSDAFDRVKFEVDYIKHLATMCAAAVAFIAGYLKAQDDKPPTWMSSRALAAFILAACSCTAGYMLRNWWVIWQDKPLWQIRIDMALGWVTALVFFVGVVLLLLMCFRPLRAAANHALQTTGPATPVSRSSQLT